MSVQALIEDSCSKLNSSSFYVGFDINDYYNYYSESLSRPYKQYAIGAIKTVVESACSPLQYVTSIVNPHERVTSIYKVDAGIVKAYPILSGKDFDRFFMPSPYIDKLDGIVLVSHKLKMLNFCHACIDVSQHPVDRIPLWIAGTTKWKWWCAWSVYAIDDGMPIFAPNKLHANYKLMFTASNKKGVTPFDICLNIEDHFKNELLCEKIAVENEIAELDKSISSAKHIIESQQQKISEFQKTIDSCNEGLKKFEVDLYASRVEADLIG